MQGTFRNGVVTTAAGIGIGITYVLESGAPPPSAAPPCDAFRTRLLSGHVLPEVPQEDAESVFGRRRRSACTDPWKGGQAWRDNASTP